ncbi:precorrin-6A reductase [Paenibacillus oenotherae]|uniref:Precorrin-6A reductase n=1 Tax=Paenibacillus oenotherae TaxID=1435645 RepID=A0ABS7D341_9BACL|nr:precorrin-6A reductase [Paenibacillus oenotherae]MBW7474344.1 precorrin-6A reductase [Paenibacillus oenotherae]
MSRDLLFLAGTGDARELAVRIGAKGYTVLATVVTDSAAKSLAEAGIDTRVGRLAAAEMSDLIASTGIAAVVDASHPFAEEASRNAIAAAEAASVPYIRYERGSRSYHDHPNVTIVDDYAGAAELAAQRRGVIMLTTGSKTLSVFTERLLGVPDTRLIARMLPRLDNMEKCEALGVEQKNIVAMQGPFSKELNKALFQQFGVTLMITKESGKEGAVDDKLEAALEMGIDTIMIGRPAVDYGTQFSGFDEVIAQIERMIGRR